MDAVVRELEIALTDAVADHGGRGDVIVEDGLAQLIDARGRVSMDVEMLLGQWRVIASIQRQRKVDQIGRDLVERQRARDDAESRPPPAKKPQARSSLDAETVESQLILRASPAVPDRTPDTAPSPAMPAQRREAAPPPLDEPFDMPVRAPPPPAAPADFALGVDELPPPRRREGSAKPPPAPTPPAAATFAAEREIEVLLRDALGGFGVSGMASVHGNQVELRAGGVPVSIELDGLAEQWPLLPQEIRRRRVGDLARRLVSAQRGGLGRRLTRRGTGIVSVPIAGLVVAGALLMLAGKWYLFDRKPEVRPVAALPVETEEQARARRARVCEAARKRLYAGASIGPFDMEGWYAELWLARAAPGQDLKTQPEVVALAAGGKLSAAADPALSSLADGTVQIVDGFAPERAARSPGWSAVTVRFGGAYVGALLDTALRPRFLALADRLADQLAADTGALYGRCAHLSYRELGAWFRGADARSAAASLVYAAGMHAEVPAVDATALGRLGGAGEIDALRGAAGKMDAAALGAAVTPHGGTLVKGAGKTVTVTFPLGGGTRATSASRSVARALGVGTPE